MGLQSLLARRNTGSSGNLSSHEREKRFENIVRTNFNKQNFKEIFLFKSPCLFYNLIIFVSTCNSLYLAWWATNFLFLILRLDGTLSQLSFFLVSLVPPLVTLPTIFLAIRSSTIVKAISLLDLSVVAHVIEQSQINTTMLAEFRKTLLKVMKKQGIGLPGMIRTCDQFAEKHGNNSLKKSEFREMLLHHKIIYTPEKINFLFGSIDLNGGSTLDYGVSIDSASFYVAILCL